MISREKNVQILIALLKQYEIKDIVVSPGNTNTSFVGSIQNDPFFNLFSCVDERSAAYMACGISQSNLTPVVISCTGATASRNYFPALTEAYYRKLPILALTSSQQYSRIGHLIAQTLDRSTVPNDVVQESYRLPIVKDKEDFFDCEIKVNRALNILKSNNPGPVHLDLPTTFETPFDVIKLPQVRKISVHTKIPPQISPRPNTAIFLGSRSLATPQEISEIEQFCENFNAVVLCDHTSGYYGRYRVDGAILFAQEKMNKNSWQPDVLIHAGQVSGDYYSMSVKPKEVWRVDTSGEIQDTFRKLKYVFNLPLADFLSTLNKEAKFLSNPTISAYRKKVSELRKNIPELPFSNLWIASQISSKLPEKSSLHFGILNSLRSWNFFGINDEIRTYCNVGGFGIDGALSTFIGTSLASPDSQHIIVLGDLAFFYDINVLGNRHLGENLKILLINNGEGTEFKTYGHHATYFGDKTSEYISAKGHNGNQSKHLLKDFMERLGFKYLQADSKTEFLETIEEFLTTQGRNVIFEVFTNSVDEARALQLMRSIEIDRKEDVKSSVKKMFKNTRIGKSLKKHL